MNSIFSSFDALCAEFLGQAVRPSFASTTNKDGNSFLTSRGLTNKMTENMKERPEGNVEKKQQRAPRFAPELDGLNCFETLINLSDGQEPSFFLEVQKQAEKEGGKGERPGNKFDDWYQKTMQNLHISIVAEYIRKPLKGPILLQSYYHHNLEEMNGWKSLPANLRKMLPRKQIEMTVI
ncbi:hypothetical protein CRYUN_Cryun13aG0100400 [Craigia yunnanensis]